MSESVRPSIPRPRTSAPTARPTAPPPPPAPASGPALIKTTPPAAMRERLATLDLDDGDIVGVAVKPIKTGPPAVPVPKTSAPPPPHATSVPPPPASSIALIGQSPTPAKATTLAHSFSAPAVPTFAPTPSVRPRIDTEVEIERGWDDAAASFAPPSWAEDTAPALPPVAAAPASIAPPALVSVAPAAMSVAPPPVSMMRPVTPAQPVAPQLLRLSINDPTDLIFDGMYGLTFARSTGEAAEMCAETLARALGARAVVIHTHDLVSRELRAIGAHGDGDFDIIGSAEASDDDLVAAAVICNQRSVTMKFDGELPRLAPKRLHAVGSPRTVVAAPAMSWGRCLAIIEVIDADERYAARVADSAAYVADHFAQFLCAHAA